MANSRDFTGKNRKFTGTKGIVTPKGTTGQRVGAESGELRFNTTTELMEYYDGNSWKPIDAPPTISSVSTSDSVGTNNILNADGSTLHTITITGGNFSLNPTVKFIGSTGTEYTAGNINRVSASSITCTTLNTMGTTDDPYDVRVTNTSSLTATLDDAFSYNASPVFTVASGTLGEVYNGQTISGTTFNAGATDAEGNTITFTIISGSLPGSGLTISSSTGAITGTLSGTPSLGNYPFVVRASTTEGVVERQFSIQVTAFPFITATGGTVTTDGDYKVHSFTGPGTFTVTGAGTPAGSNTVQTMIVAGGGAGGPRYGGGGGGGGMVLTPACGLPVSATGYPIAIGGGGAAFSNPSGPGAPENGVDSTFLSLTAVGGGSAGHAGGGSPGGSGAGCGQGGTGQTGTQPVQPGNSGTFGFGNPGAGCPSGPTMPHGGGGGAGAAATHPGSSGTDGQPGGAGKSVTPIFGAAPKAFYGPTSGVYAGGGGGGSQGAGAGTGGPGGGGPAANPGNPGATNTGGGGGGSQGCSQTAGGNGGSGKVLIRYKFQ
jgi:hypothetical protein